MAAVIRPVVRPCQMKRCWDMGTHLLYDSKDRLWGQVCKQHAVEGAAYIDWWEMIDSLSETSLWELCPPLPDEIKALNGVTS